MRKRIILPKLLFVPVLGIALISHHIWREEGVVNLSFEVCALLLVTIAAIGRIWVAAYISGRKNEELVVEGPYSIVRNPLYFFSLIGFIGAGLAFEMLTFAVAFGLLFAATHVPAIFSEERFLRAKFGDQFETYIRSVPRLFPRTLRASCPGEMRISSRIYSRAVLDSSLIVGMYLLAHVVEWGHLHHLLPVYFCLP